MPLYESHGTSYLKRYRVFVDSDKRVKSRSKNQFDFVFELDTLYENVVSIELVDHNLKRNVQQTFVVQNGVEEGNNIIDVFMDDALTESNPYRFSVTIPPRDYTYAEDRLASDLSQLFNEDMDEGGHAFHNTSNGIDWQIENRSVFIAASSYEKLAFKAMRYCNFDVTDIRFQQDTGNGVMRHWLCAKAADQIDGSYLIGNDEAVWTADPVVFLWTGVLLYHTPTKKLFTYGITRMPFYVITDDLTIGATYYILYCSGLDDSVLATFSFVVTAPNPLLHLYNTAGDAFSGDSELLSGGPSEHPVSDEIIVRFEFENGDNAKNNASVPLGFIDGNDTSRHFMTLASDYFRPFLVAMPTPPTPINAAPFRYLDVYIKQVPELESVGRIPLFYRTDGFMTRRQQTNDKPRLLVQPLKHLDELHIVCSMYPAKRSPLELSLGGIDLVFDIIVIAEDNEIPEWLEQTLVY